MNLNPFHIKKKINLFNNELIMHIYNYNEAKKKGCDGITKNSGEALDIISKCLENDGCWEPYQTEITKELLKNGNNIFLDVGSHLGYYSLLASVYNNQVISIEMNTNYIYLFEKSILDNKIQNINIIKQCVTDKFSLDSIINVDSYIKLIKCDIEGYEIEFVESILERLTQKKIENLILEISPTLRDNYPEYIIKIKNLGYFIYDLGLSPQRKLDNSTTLKSLKDKVINIDNIESMRNYINSFPEKQSNFLFSTINYIE